MTLRPRERYSSHLIRGDVLLVRHRVPAAVGIELDVARVVAGLQQLGDGRVVAGLGRADEPVVRDVEHAPRVAVALDGPVGPLLGGDAVGLGRLLDLEAVLVRAGQEEHVVASEAVPAGDGVGDERWCRRGRRGARRSRSRSASSGSSWPRRVRLGAPRFLLRCRPVQEGDRSRSPSRPGIVAPSVRQRGRTDPSVGPIITMRSLVSAVRTTLRLGPMPPSAGRISACPRSPGGTW